MSVNSTIFKNTEIAYVPRVVGGLAHYSEGLGNFGLRAGAMFSVCTGSTNLPDATPGQAANITLLGDRFVPAGMRCYLTSVTMVVNGQVNWSNTSPTAGAMPALYLQDSAGVPAVMAPFTSLRGGAVYKAPFTGFQVPLLFGPNTVTGPFGIPITTFTYVPATGVVTVGATSFVANYGVGGVARVVGGTGIGQSAVITAITATTFTVSPPFTGLDATSVLAVDHMGVATYSSTTALTLFAGGGTPWTANQMGGSVSLVGTGGSSAGGALGVVDLITSNTNAGVLTVPALLGALTSATSIIRLTSNPAQLGVVDCGVGGPLAVLTPGKGLQVAVNNQAGTSPLGSAVRVFAEGFFSNGT